MQKQKNIGSVDQTIKDRRQMTIQENLSENDLPDNHECHPCYQHCEVIGQMMVFDNFVRTACFAM